MTEWLDADSEEEEVAPTPEEHEQEEKFHEAVAAQSERQHPLARTISELRTRDAMSLMIPPPEKGQGRQIRGTIDTHTGVFIQRLLASKKWPWKDEGAFVRSAIAYMIRGAHLDKDKEFRGYFKRYWEEVSRAQLIQRLEDVTRLASHIERAVRAYLGVNKIDQAVVYLRGVLKTHRAAAEEFDTVLLDVLEQAFNNGGPQLRSVWARAQKEE